MVIKKRYPKHRRELQIILEYSLPNFTQKLVFNLVAQVI